ncbi:MAG TPA: CoA transferase, partial [Acidimicrobiales bacterium]
MTGPGPLAGVRVLDFSTVGPAARSARWLADYGADVVKIGAPARAGAVQIEPVFYAYSAHRAMRRI